MEIHFRFLNSKERTQIRLEDNYLARGKHMREISWSGIQPNILTRNSTKKTFLVEQQTTIVSTFPVCFFIDFHPGKCKSKQRKALNPRGWGRGGRAVEVQALGIHLMIHDWLCTFKYCNFLTDKYVRGGSKRTPLKMFTNKECLNYEAKISLESKTLQDSFVCMCSCRCLLETVMLTPW